MSDSLILGSNLVSFLPDISKADRADILDVLLLAELSASSRYDRHEQWESWIYAYRRVLMDSGLKTRPVLFPEPVTVSSEKGFRRETANLLQAIRPERLVAVAKSALDQLFSSGHAQSFFKKRFGFNAGRSDSFQVIPCQQAASGLINMALCGIEMVTRTRIKPPNIGGIPDIFAYRMTLTYRGWNFVFDRDIYAQHRARVREQLQDMDRELLEFVNL